MNDTIDWDARAKAITDSRRSLWSGLGLVALTSVLIYTLSLEFSRAADLLQNGTPATATAVSEGRMIQGRKGRISYATEVLLDGVATTLELGSKLQAGDRFRLIYSPERLADWSSHRKGKFYSYMIGDSKLSTSALVEQKLGGTYTFGRWIVAAFGVIGAYFLYDFYRVRRNLRNMDLWHRKPPTS